MSKATFITNIRYGGLPVRKVYLGDKLVWQCIETLGESEIYLQSKGMIHAHNPIFSAGNANNDFYTDARSKIFDSILSDGNFSVSLNIDSNTKSCESILSDGNLSLSLKTFVNGDAFQEILSDGKLKLCLTNNNFNGNSFDSILSDGKLKMRFKDSVKGDSFTANLLKTSLNLILDNVVNINNIPTAIFLKSALNFGFTTKNFVSSNKANLLESYKKDQDIDFQTRSAAIFWYPPVGDDIPLNTDDGIDITIDGEIIEIQQAYQVIIDDENKILEVI